MKTNTAPQSSTHAPPARHSRRPAARVQFQPFILALACFATLVLATGCIAPKSYVDTKYRPSRQGSAQVHNRPVHLTVVAQLNGLDHGAAARFWQGRFEKTFAASGFVMSPSGAELRITMNNLGSLGAAAGSGALTGLTLGAVGSKVTDRYVMTVQYTGRTRTYEHAIHTVIGNASAPTGAVGPMSPIEAANQVGDDLIRRFLNDLE